VRERRLTGAGIDRRERAVAPGLTHDHWTVGGRLRGPDAVGMCVLCLLSPDAQQMVGPMAQAVVIVGPIVLRDRIRQGVGVVRRRRRSTDVAPTSAPTDLPASRGWARSRGPLPGRQF
jgi:hypothetical protein